MVEQLPIPEEVTGNELTREVRQELRSLPRTLAEDVAKNLVMVARLLDEDPELAYRYARIALRLASRVAAVREAAGFAAYAVEKYAEALAEFRAARRMTGGTHLWPVMADCERGLGRPERALAMAGAPEVKQLDKAGQVEMRLVAAGARRDMGQLEAALVTLKVPELASGSTQPWAARLRYAYADTLLAMGRKDEARRWFARALESDQSGATNASDRLAELDGLEFVDALDPHAEEELEAETAARPEGEARRPEGDDRGASAPPQEGGATGGPAAADAEPPATSGDEAPSTPAAGGEASGGEDAEAPAGPAESPSGERAAGGGAEDGSDAAGPSPAPPSDPAGPDGVSEAS